MKCPQGVEAGAYVLGALSPAERSAYQRHLSTCDDCRYEVADLAGLPGLLGRLDEATAAGLGGFRGHEAERPSMTIPTVKAPPSALTGALARVRRERTRSRRRRRFRAMALGVAVACLALLVGVGVTAAIDRAHRPGGVVIASMDAVQKGEPVTAVIGFQKAKDGGTDLQMSCVYADSDGNGREWDFKLIVYTRAGASAASDTWWAGPGEAKKIVVHTTFAPADIDRIEVQRVNGDRLLVYKVT
jgi:hypothetical protein